MEGRLKLTRRLAASLGVLSLTIAGAACDALERRTVQAGLTFDAVSFSSSRLPGALDGAQIEAIRAAARTELADAFRGWNITFTDARAARFQVAVVQEIRDPRLRRAMFVAGESRAVAGFGGRGAVNFSLLASAAVSCAPDGATASDLVAAIGRGIGRAAAHEFAHQLLPKAPLHDTHDVRSYEYRAASRCEQYFGPMHWDLAGPLLEDRLGLRGDALARRLPD